MVLSVLAFYLLISLGFSRTTEVNLQHRLRSNIESLRGTPLNVSECTPYLEEDALDCEKLGYFVRGFRQLAYWTGADGKTQKRVPVNGLQCCRPSIPPSMTELLPEDVYPISIVSIGCHISNNKDTSDLSCEQDRQSLVSGFVDSVSTGKGDQLIIPAKGVSCCTPVLLLSTGDAWELELCNLETSSDPVYIQCGSNKLLWGFYNSGRLAHQRIPIGPAVCSELCLGDSILDLKDCEQHRHCNGNGVCVLGECECFSDWIGSDCSTLKSEYFAEPETRSSVWWLGGLGFIGAFFCLFATLWMVRRTEQHHEQRQEVGSTPGQIPDPEVLNLISSFVNETGSAGSTDTESEEVSPSIEDQMDLTITEESKVETLQPLLQMNCCICETRSVQITLVPCGHSNLCRKCSRKLNNCPFCRKPIFRRQRLFLSA